jgi:ATP-binding cassette subfamily E protein 1
MTRRVWTRTPMTHRVAVLLADRCQPKRCQQECIRFCPPVRSGVTETIYMGDHGKPVITENLCIGCGICVQKCPFSAIRIIGLPEELEQETIQRYGRNGFRLFRLPVPQAGQCVGILGPNGIGKTTAMRVLSGQEVPNLGDWAEDHGPAAWDKVVAHFRGTEAGEYLKAVASGQVVTAVKPQYVDQIPKAFPGKKVEDMLRQADKSGRWSAVVPKLNIEHILDRTLDQVSGGELQRIAIAATLLKDADVYFFDEPSSYLDIHERLRVAKVLRRLAETKRVLVIEHDLAILDFLCDLVHIVYGVEGAYGVMTKPRPVRNAVNAYLRGFLEEENIRIRDQAIEFEARPPRAEAEMVELLSFPRLRKTLGAFTLEAQPGAIHHGQVVGVVGPNGTGKTTFAKMLAGVLAPDEGAVGRATGDAPAALDFGVRIAYKPQYIKAEYDGTLRDFLSVEAPDLLATSGFAYAEVARPLDLHSLLDKRMDALSGGELQRAAICLCLVQNAQIFVMDEPSAYLDANQRIQAAKTVRRVMEKQGRSALIIDHDVYFLDLVADSIMVFGGEPGVRGTCEGPYPMRDGMNRFLAAADVTFRRDNDTHRPRINKPGSRLDRQQREAGEYYYQPAETRETED